MPRKNKSNTIFQHDKIATLSSYEQTDNENIVQEERHILKIDKSGIESTASVDDEIHRLIKENSDLTDQLDEYINKVDQLQIINKKQEEKIDELTMKISELTFKIAKEKQKILDSCENEINNENSESFTQQLQQNNNLSKQIKYPHYNNNGYSSWN